MSYQKERISAIVRRSVLIVILSSLLILSACTPRQASITWQEQYDLGVRYLSEGNYEEAILAFNAAIKIDPKEDMAYVALANTYINKGDIPSAERVLQQAIEVVGETEEIKAALSELAKTKKSLADEILDNAVNDSNDMYTSICPTRTGLISTSGWHTAAVRADGTVLAAGDNKDGRLNVQGWTDIVAVSTGFNHTVGLKADGTVLATGSNEYGQCDVSAWNNIVAISAGFYYTVGLKEDGTVVAVGDNEDGQCNVQHWAEIVAIDAGSGHTIGLKKDGTAVAVGRNNRKQCDILGWADLTSISSGFWNTTAGTFSDGRAIAIGRNDEGQCDVSNWANIVAVDTQGWHTVGLKSDGTVVAVGSNETARCNVSEWTDIIAISAGNGNTVGIRADGTAVATAAQENDLGACDIGTWAGLFVPEEFLPLND